MNEEEVQVNENSEPAESSNETDPEPVQTIQEVVVTNLDEVIPYYELNCALLGLVIGLLIMVIVALGWVREL